MDRLGSDMSGVYLPISLMNQLNTGDFDGDTVFFYNALASQFSATAKDKDIADWADQRTKDLEAL